METQIALAVAPLKDAAVARAVAAMDKAIAAAAAELEAAGWDLNKAAPYPSIHMSRPAYMQARGRRAFLESLVARTDARPSYMPGAPYMVRMDDERTARMLAHAAEMAAADFEAFVAKLDKKIGAHTAAALIVNGTWQYSVIEVETDAGTQRWKTQQIVNVSCLGKLFNQWPTRLMK